MSISKIVFGIQIDYEAFIRIVGNKEEYDISLEIEKFSKKYRGLYLEDLSIQGSYKYRKQSIFYICIKRLFDLETISIREAENIMMYRNTDYTLCLAENKIPFKEPAFMVIEIYSGL